MIKLEPDGEIDGFARGRTTGARVVVVVVVVVGGVPLSLLWRFFCVSVQIEIKKEGKVTTPKNNRHTNNNDRTK